MDCKRISMVEIDAVVFTAIMCALWGFLLGGATSRQRFGRIAYKQGLRDGKSRCLSHFDNWFDYEVHRTLLKELKKELEERGFRVDEWVAREVIDTLRQADITLLGVTGLDSPQEFAKKCRENETAINRRIHKAISLLESSLKEE